MNSKDTHPLPPDSFFNWSRRNFLQGTGAVAALTAAGLPVPSLAESEESDHLITLDAAGLAEGALPKWPNTGSLGGGFAPAGGTPARVEVIAGRKAVVFDGTGVLKSDFVLPRNLAGRSPFTVMLWVYTAQLQNRAVMFALGSRPKVSAEFNLHRSSHGHGNAAFEGFGGRRAGYHGGSPPAGKWHHIAYTHAGGDHAAFRVYVNGELAAEAAFGLHTDAGEPVTIGGAFDARKDLAISPFAGAIAELRVIGRPLSMVEVRNFINLHQAFGPGPAHDETVLAKEATLEWFLGRAAAQSTLFVATEESELAAAKPFADPEYPITIDEVTGHCRCGPLPLVIGRTYFWRVNQRDPDSGAVDIGTLWKFSVSTGPATAPQPRNLLTGISPSLSELNWSPGPYATAQALFFGTDAEAVRDATEPAARLAADVTAAKLPLALEPGRTYFWRIATTNAKDRGDAGELWQFRTNDTPVKNDVTFFIATDQHYGHGANYQLNRNTVDLMNRAAGMTLPDNFGGGFVRTPLAVVDPGDLLDKGYDPSNAAEKWAEWVEHYGLDGTDGVLGFPVLEGVGNHDSSAQFSLPRQEIRKRNQIRKSITEVSDNGLHYSWDWDHVHLVNTNLFPGDGGEDVMNVSPANHNPEGALRFLKHTLAKHVGTSGKPVIVFTHYGLVGGMSDWWTPEAKERFHEAIKGYNVICIFNGHSHGVDFPLWKGIQTIHCGATARPDSGGGDFMVIRVTETELSAISLRPDGWGNHRKIPINTPAAFRA